MDRLNAHVVTEYEEFLSLEPEWSELLQTSRSNLVFLTHEWFRCWWESFAGARQLHMICVRDGQRLVGVAPLCLQRGRFRGLPVRKLAFLANAYSAEADFITAQPEEPIMAAICEHLCEHRDEWDMLELQRLRDDSPVLKFWRKHAQTGRLAAAAREDIQVPYIPIEGTWQTYLSHRSRNHRKAIRRRLNLIHKHPGIIRVVRLSSPAELSEALSEAVGVSGRSWKAQYGRAIPDDAAVGKFFQRLSELAGAKDWVDLWMVYCDGVPVAFEYHLRYAGVTAPIRADFDESHAAISPGAYLEFEILRRLFETSQGDVREYNTCADGYAYELKWTDHIRPHSKVWFFAPTWYGKLLHLVALLRRPVSGRRLRKTGSCRARSWRGERRSGPGRRRAVGPRVRPSRRGQVVDVQEISMSGARTLGRLTRQAFRVAWELASDLPVALRREYRYYTGHRPRALLCLTWACTSRCAMCTSWRRPRKKSQELTAEEWLQVGRKLASRGVRTVELFGGDVLLRKEVVFPLIKELDGLGCDIHMATNCNLLDEETARALADSVHTIYLSTDGVEDTHDRVRGVDGTFARVCQALERLLQARGDRKRPKLVCITTVSKDNCRDVLKVARFAIQAGYDHIEIDPVGEIPPESIPRSMIGDCAPSPIFLKTGESVLVPPREIPVLRRLLRTVRQELQGANGKNGHFSVESGDIDYLSDAQLAKGVFPFRRCFMERCCVVIDPYGNLVPCVLFDTYAVDNVRSGALERSWETARRARFRAYRDSGRLELCRYCHMTPVWNKTARDLFRRALLAGLDGPADEPTHRDDADER